MDGSLRQKNIAAAGALLTLGCYTVYSASQWQYITSNGPGPGFFPIWYGIAIIIFSIVLGLQYLRKPSGDIAQSSKNMERGDVHIGGTRRVIGTVLAMTACVALMPWLGFLLAFGLLSLFMLKIVFKRKWVEACLSSIIFVLGFYLVFKLGLQVQLQPGILGF